MGRDSEEDRVRRGWRKVPRKWPIWPIKIIRNAIK